MVVPSKQMYVSPKSCHTLASTITPPLAEGDSSRKPHLQLGCTPTKLRDSGAASRGGCPGVALTTFPEKNKINKVDPFWAIVNHVRDNNSTDVMKLMTFFLILKVDNEAEEDGYIVSQTRTD